MSGTGSESTKMRTRSQSRPDAIEDDTSSVITNVSDSSFTDDADDNSIEGDPEVCFACDKIIEGLIIHKGGTWCVECINIEKNKDDALEQRMQRSNRYPIWILVSLCILIPAVVGGYYADLEIMPFSPSKGVIKNHTTCADLKAEIKRLKSDFASQESDTWYNFYSGIENVLPGPNAVGSTTFLLLHEARARQTADRIARQVGRLAAGCLGGNLLHLEGTTIAADPSKHELFLQTYQKKVEESRVLYVSEFERLPSGVAKEFHFFCDSYTPLVPHSVFVLLLQVESLPNGDDVTAAAESQLKRIWGRDLPTNIIQPLITRITANVVRIYE